MQFSNAPYRIVQKFGGTSVGSADAMLRVGRIVQSHAARRPLVVASAVGGVTSKLFRLVHAARDKAAWEPELDELRALHATIARELALDDAPLAPLFTELHDVLRGVWLLGELTPRTLDYVASFGERLSVRLLAAHLSTLGLEAEALDAWDAGLVTNSHFGSARPTAAAAPAIRAALSARRTLPVVTGYIGRDAHGHVTTLGRGGSDYSAAIFGAALSVEEIQIWTDVDGVLTSDPRKVPTARLVPNLSFAEAAELAFFGAKVLHPATMVPAVERDIPIRVLNTFRPEAPGTRVVSKLAPEERGVKSIATKDRIVVVNVEAGEMMFQYGFLKQIADAFARHEVVIDVIATSEVSVALTVDPNVDLQALEAELATFAKVGIVRDIALVSVVGEELRERSGFAAQVFAVVAELSVSLEMISYGATRNNLSFVVPRKRLDEVVRALHERLFAR